MTALIWIGAVMAALIGFALIDRWHARWAWRKADEEARAEFKRRKPRGG